MTEEEFERLVREIDPSNAEYIMANQDVINSYESLRRWEEKAPSVLSVISKDEDTDARCARVAHSVREELEARIRRFDSMYLTPANAKVGDGATVNLYSDRHAGTIIKVTKSSITIRRDKATRDPGFKPEFIPGGFAAHCTNQDEQQWTYEQDSNGQLDTIRWSQKYNQYGTPGNPTVSKGRHEFYDYNF